MSIVRRMRDITVASLNDMLEKSEDPVKLIDQYLLAQHEQIRQLEQLYQQCVNHRQSLKQQYLQAESLREKREKQASLALQAGEEQLARLALEEKLLQEERSNQYLQLYEQSEGQVAELEEQLARLKSDYQEVYNKRQYYLARLESVRLQRKMNERLSSAGVGGWRMFDRLEDQLTDWETEAKIVRDLKRAGQQTMYRLGGAVQEALERELAQLKKKLQEEEEGGKIQ